MSPQRPRSRPPAARLSILSLVIGAALAAAPAAARAADHPRYGRLPVLARDWQHLPAQPGGTDPVAAEQRRQAAVTRRWHEVHDLLGSAQISRRSWDRLSRRGLGPALLAGGPAKAEPSSVTDTLRVLIVRISFAANRDPALTTIPADGNFMLTPDPNPAPIPIDPPPHDKAYFESHLRGLSEFYRYQSGGRLHIQGRVLPDDPDGSYQLSDIADYGPGAGGFWTLDGLEALVRQMIVTADAGTPADGVDLADYGDGHPFTYVIFVHAGSDWQSDINGDSPNDIPTFFISLGEPQALTGGSLSECSIIPETTTQDGYEGSIAAALYHEFGHALGLPDVYSTETGLPSVGVWDLMDSGTNLPVTLGAVVAPGDTVVTVATGVLPPSISAWNKWFLGWLDMAEVKNGGGDVFLPAVGVPKDQYVAYRESNPNFQESYPQAVRGGVSPREWFLMENRWVPASPASTPYDSLQFERDEDTGVILYLAGYRQGTWQNSGLYDYFLPLGGVLVWHVNMDRIESGLPDNTINGDGDGLRLVEADGIQDIGVLDAYVRGWYGSYTDPFGDQADQNGTLHAEGHPNSRCFDRSWTGLTLTDVRKFGGTHGVVRFGAHIDGMAKGFPWETTSVDSAEAAASGGTPGPRGIDPASLTPVVIGDRPVMIFADAAPADWSGGSWPTGLNSADNGGATGVIGGAPAGRPTSEFAQLTATLAGPPQGWTMADGSARLLVGTADGQVTFFSFAAANGWPTRAWTADLGDTLGTAPLAGGPDAATATALVLPGAVATVDLADGAATVRNVPGETGWRGTPRLVEAADGLRLVAFGAASWRSLVPAGSTASGEYAAAYPRTPRGAVHTVAVGDWSALYDDDGLVGAWDRTGAPAAAPDPGAPLVAEPAVADLDGDGRQDVLLATAERIFAARPDGTVLTGFPAQLREMFPLADTTRVATPLVVADADGDGADEVWFGTNAGHLLSLTARGRLRPRFPFRWGDRAGSGFAVTAAETDGGGRVLWLASAGGYGGQDRDHVLVGGRLTGLRLAAVAAAGTSEWLAAAGGAARLGPEGTAQSLGAAAPAAADAGRVVLYPNPVNAGGVTVRFTGPVDGTARVTLYDLEGETVADQSFAVTGGEINEHTVDLPGIASGLYLCRLQWPTGGGSETRTMTLAVER